MGDFSFFFCVVLCLLRLLSFFPYYIARTVTSSTLLAVLARVSEGVRMEVWWVVCVSVCEWYS